MKIRSHRFSFGLSPSSWAFAAALPVVGLATPSAHAAVAIWDAGGGTQNWNTVTNWSGDAFPTGNFPAGVATINTATGPFPVISANSVFTPSDILIGTGASQSGRLDQTAGTVSTGVGNRLILGANGGAGTFNLSGGTFMGGVYMASTATTGTAIATVSGTGTLASPEVIIVADGHNATATAVGTLNVESGGTVNSEGDLILARSGNSSSTGELNIAAGATVNVASTTKRWMIINHDDSGKGRLNINGGTLNLNADTDLRFSVGTGIGTSVLNLNSGNIIGGPGSVLDLNRNSTGAVNNTVNLNGGTLAIAGIVGGGIGNRVFNFNGGTLKATATANGFFNSLVPSAARVLAGGAIIDSNGFDISIQQALTADPVSTGGGLTKNGSGKLWLYGAHTYTGQTTVNAGMLEIDGSLTSNLVVNSGATLKGSVTNSKRATFNSGSALCIGYSPIRVNGVTFAGPTHVIFESLVGSGQHTLLNYGTGSVTGISNLVSGYRMVVTKNTATSEIRGTVTIGTLAWNNNSGTWVTGGTGWKGDFTTYFDGDHVSFGEPSAASTVTLNGVLMPGNVIVNNRSNPYTFSGSGSLGRFTVISKEGAGTLNLATSNPELASVRLNAGTLNLANPTALNGSLWISGGVIDNTSGSAIVMTRNAENLWLGDFTFTGTGNLDIGTGDVRVWGDPVAPIRVTVSAGTLAAGNLTISTSAQYAGLVKRGAGKLEIGSIGTPYNFLGLWTGGSIIYGPLTVSAGMVQINRTGAHWGNSGDLSAEGLAGSGTITNGALLERWIYCKPFNDEHFSGILADGGSGPLGFYLISGNQTLSGANTYTGRTTVSTGTLTISQPFLADKGEVVITGHLKLTHNAIDQVGSLSVGGSPPLPNGIYDKDSPETSYYISGTGKLRVGPPPGIGYSTWAAAHAGGGSPDGDFDNDGTDNGVEYFMGATDSTSTANPSVVTTGTVRTVTWPNGGNIAATEYGSRFVVQTSADLLTWTNVLAVDPNLNNTPSGVTYTLTGTGNPFVRLKLTPN